MQNQLSKALMCIQMRSGVEIWVEHDKALILQRVLEKITGSKFIFFEDQTINTADIVGVFSAETMQDMTRRKNGQWLCKFGEWHDRKETCNCYMPTVERTYAPTTLREITDEERDKNIAAIDLIREKHFPKK